MLLQIKVAVHPAEDHRFCDRELFRPEKPPITKSMIFGWMDRDFYLKEHDPERWVIETSSSSSPPSSSSASTSRRVAGQGLTDAG